MDKDTHEILTLMFVWLKACAVPDDLMPQRAREIRAAWDRIEQLLEQTKPTVEALVGPTSMGSAMKSARLRLSPHFEPSPAMRKFQADLGLSEDEARREAAKFKAYWSQGRGAGTARTAKGWAQTWQSWMSRAAERNPKPQGGESDRLRSRII